MSIHKVFKKNWLLLAPLPVIIVSVVMIYFKTTANTVVYGDSGEYITVGKILGIAHPPGYPLYTILAHLFTYLPLNSIAWRINFLSAVTSVFALIVFYFACYFLTKR